MLSRLSLPLALCCFAWTARAAGTLETDGRVRMTAHEVHAVLHDRLAAVVVEQTFFSDDTRQREGAWVFSLPDGAVVSGFAMTMNGRMVAGEVVERGKAHRVYEDVVRRRRDPGLLEKLDREVFRARVFPIEPGKELKIRLTYLQLLDENAGTIELRYPLDQERYGSAPLDRVSLEVEVRSTAGIRSVGCPSHAARMRWDADRKGVHVALEATPEQDDRDFQLYIHRDPADVGFSLLSSRESGREAGTLLALFAPPDRVADERVMAKDVVYVLDTSGSMKGRKLAQAKRALAFGLRKLRPGDRFGVVAFSTEARVFRHELRDATGPEPDAAVEWIRSQEATGGTALDDALQTALRLTQPGHLGLVVLLTDGLPTVGFTDTGRIIDRVTGSNPHRARLFVFGVGFDQDVELLDRLATATRAAREYVSPGQDLALVLERFFRRIDQPVLTDLRLEAGEGVSELVPRDLPDLFAGDRLVVLGRYATPGPHAFRLHARHHGKPVTYVYEGELADGDTTPGLAHLWAERRVAFLLDELKRNGTQRELVDEVVRLGTAFSIVTPYTAGLVVEDEPVPREVVVETPVETEEVTDTPFSEASTNSGIGVAGGGGGYRHLRAAGGSSWVRQAAVDPGLEWLARRQDPAAGSWTDVERTSRALLAFLGAGYSDRGSKRDNPFAKAVRTGLRYLMVQQAADGAFDASAAAHALATLAMCEAFGFTRNPRYKKPAQAGLDRLARVIAGIADPPALAYAVAALRSGRLAGLETDPDAFERTRLRIGSFRDLSTAGEAAGVWMRILLGEDPRRNEVLQRFAQRVADDPPAWETLDPQAVEFRTLALFQIGGDAWRRWHRALQSVVAGRQSADGSWSVAGNPVRETARLILSLEVSYRCDRVFGR